MTCAATRCSSTRSRIAPQVPPTQLPYSSSIAPCTSGWGRLEASSIAWGRSLQRFHPALARGQAASTLRSLICSETLRPLNRSPRGSVWLHSAWCYCPWSPSWAVQIVECLQRSTVRLSSRGWSGSCTDCWNPCDLRSHLNSLLRHRRHDVFTHLESGANASPMRLVAAAIYRAAAFFLPVITLGDLIPHIEFFCFFA